MMYFSYMDMIWIIYVDNIIWTFVWLYGLSQVNVVAGSILLLTENKKENLAIISSPKLSKSNGYENTLENYTLSEFRINNL